MLLLGESENGFVISDHWDHAASKELMNLNLDLSVPLMRHDPKDLRSQIRFWFLPKKNALIRVVPCFS